MAWFFIAWLGLVVAAGICGLATGRLRLIDPDNIDQYDALMIELEQNRKVQKTVPKNRDGYEAKRRAMVAENDLKIKEIEGKIKALNKDEPGELEDTIGIMLLEARKKKGDLPDYVEDEEWMDMHDRYKDEALSVDEYQEYVGIRMRRRLLR